MHPSPPLRKNRSWTDCPVVREVVEEAGVEGCPFCDGAIEAHLGAAKSSSKGQRQIVAHSVWCDHGARKVRIRIDHLAPDDERVYFERIGPSNPFRKLAVCTREQLHLAYRPAEDTPPLHWWSGK